MSYFLLPNLFQLKKLNFQRGEYAVCGSGPLAIRDIRIARDLDVIVKKRLWKKLSSRYKVDGYHNNLIRFKNIEVWATWMELTAELNEMVDTADVFYGIPFVNLRYTWEWKKQKKRKKDEEDLQLLQYYLIEKKQLFLFYPK